MRSGLVDETALYGVPSEPNKPFPKPASQISLPPRNRNEGGDIEISDNDALNKVDPKRDFIQHHDKPEVIDIIEKLSRNSSITQFMPTTKVEQAAIDAWQSHRRLVDEANEVYRSNDPSQLNGSVIEGLTGLSQEDLSSATFEEKMAAISRTLDNRYSLLTDVSLNELGAMAQFDDNYINLAVNNPMMLNSLRLTKNSLLGNVLGSGRAQMALLTVDVNAHLDRATTSLSFLESTVKTTVGLHPVTGALIAAGDRGKYYSLRATTKLAYQTGRISHDQAWEYSARLDNIAIENNYNTGSSIADIASVIAGPKAKAAKIFNQATQAQADYTVSTISSLNPINARTESNNPYNFAKYYEARGN
ncbi:hypothetical protein IMCC1989_2291 [gamma proteobacterium IMCC1989]|nr:hypothetical protein IMCC1989_2291 [gamma proteobacterium IMCC1989]